MYSGHSVVVNALYFCLIDLNYNFETVDYRRAERGLRLQRRLKADLDLSSGQLNVRRFLNDLAAVHQSNFELVASYNTYVGSNFLLIGARMGLLSSLPAHEGGVAGLLTSKLAGVLANFDQSAWFEASFYGLF